MNSTHAFRFGVVTSMAASGEEWLAKARRIESMGYSTLLMPDGVRYLWSPLPALTAAAVATSTLRVGTYVLANDFRNPVQVAKEAASIDVISGGRFELGLGAGRPSAADDYQALGLEFDSIGKRIERLAESVAAIRSAQVMPAPVQTPRPPLLLAGWSRRMLELAGREADIVALGMPPDTAAEAARERIGWLRDLAGDRFEELELNVNLMAVGDRVPGYLQRQSGLNAGDLAASAAALTGSPDEMCEALKRRREELGISYVVANEELMESLAPVVERLAGA